MIVNTNNNSGPNRIIIKVGASVDSADGSGMELDAITKIRLYNDPVKNIPGIHKIKSVIMYLRFTGLCDFCFR